MRAMAEEAQESRRDTISAAVSGQEKWYLQLVAKREGRELSVLIGEAVAPLIDRGRRLDEALERLPDAAEAGLVESAT